MLLGLTYKPGTNTLRRSAAVELARELDSLGFRVRASDPSQAALSPALGFVEFHPNPADGVAGADALVVCTPWPEYLALDWRDLLGRMRQPLVIDVGRFLEKSVAGLPNLRYITIGSPS